MCDCAAKHWQNIAMWQLAMKTKADKEWVHVGTFGTVTEAARRICELDGDPKDSGLFLEFQCRYNRTRHRRGSFQGFSSHRQAGALRYQARPTQLRGSHDDDWIP
jgi:hypothetical protein